MSAAGQEGKVQAQGQPPPVGRLATLALTDLAREARTEGETVEDARRRLMRTPRGRALHLLRSPAWRELTPMEAQRKAADSGCGGDVDLASAVVEACTSIRNRLERG